MFRIAICDDNPIQLETTSDLIGAMLESSGKTAETETFLSGEKLLARVREGQGFDLYILDMIMPGMNGMETATTLRLMKDEGSIVFLSASIEYAAQSYDVDAVYYLLKPVDPIRLQKVLERVINRKTKRTEIIEISGPHGTTVFPLRTIIYVKLEDRRPQYQLADGRYFLGNSLRGKFRDEMQCLLQTPLFTECGVSLVVNLTQIDVIDAESVLMRNGDLLYVSRTASASLMTKWLDFRKRS